MKIQLQTPIMLKEETLRIELWKGGEEMCT